MTSEAKRIASHLCISQRLLNHQVVGIGSGSTIVYAVEKISQLHKDGKLQLKALIPSSFQAMDLINKHNLPLGTLNQYPKIDITFDGCDEFDKDLNLIKGGGGCHLLEKLIIQNSKECYIVCDYTKESEVLGTNWYKGVPLEVIPQSYKAVQLKLISLGASSVEVRMAKMKAGPVITDEGNMIIDAKFGQITNPMELNDKLLKICGIVETGLFCQMVNGIYLGMQDGTAKFTEYQN